MPTVKSAITSADDDDDNNDGDDNEEKEEEKLGLHGKFCNIIILEYHISHDSSLDFCSFMIIS